MSEQDFLLEKGRPLAPLSTFHIGGPAAEFTEVTAISQMQSIIRFCKLNNRRYLILGKGSNILFDDRGFDGIVILNKINFCKDLGGGQYHVGAGYSFSRLGALTARRGFSGLEFASGIPGSVGGAVFMNAGANGHETCETLTSVDFVDEEGCLLSLTRQQLTFAYRSSPFQTMNGAIVGATFSLNSDTEARQRQIEIVHYRQETQPYGEHSAGCIFRNPQQGSAGALIEQSGLKGMRVGGAEVSGVHANFLINAQKASSRDMRALLSEVQRRVKEKTGADLESEVRYIPYQEKEDE